MKRICLDRWVVQLQPPRNPRLRLHQQRCPFSHDTRSAPRRHLQLQQRQLREQWQCQRRSATTRRKASSAAVAQIEEIDEDDAQLAIETNDTPLNAPSHQTALRSAKLSALHARLSLPARLPLQTLARCLIDPSVDHRPGYNNAPLALLGSDLLGYYTAEWLLTHYPRLPMPVLFAAQYAYVGAATLAAIRGEWGVEVVAAPGPEVDAGLLQLKRITPGNAMAEGEQMRVKDVPVSRRLVGTGRGNEQWSYRRGTSSRIVYDDQFGDLQFGLPEVENRQFVGAPISAPADGTMYPMEGVQDRDEEASASIPQANLRPRKVDPNADIDPTTVETASAAFIRAVAGAIYLHCGTHTTKSFYQSHILSRHLSLHTLFHFTHPTRDLSRLCAREGFEPPVARLISETGRLSRSPVFIVGVFSGGEKLGEAAGGSLNEGRVRAAAAALRSWYLYSPPEGDMMVPSELEVLAPGEDVMEKRKKWKAGLVDIGEVVT